VKCGVWSVECGVWSVECGSDCEVCVEWSEEWAVNCRLRRLRIECGQRSVGCQGG
jgi:hypothetical protein